MQRDTQLDRPADRFILSVPSASAGHGSDAALRAPAPDRLKDMTPRRAEELSPARSKDRRDTPNYGHAKGVETTTGPLGQGPAPRWASPLPRESCAARFGHGRCSTITPMSSAGDGCLMEGIRPRGDRALRECQAAPRKLHRPVGRKQHLRSDGEVSLSDITDQRMGAFQGGRQWQGCSPCDGPRPQRGTIDSAIERAKVGVEEAPRSSACRPYRVAVRPPSRTRRRTHGSPPWPTRKSPGCAKSTTTGPHAPFVIPFG